MVKRFYLLLGLLIGGFPFLVQSAVSRPAFRAIAAQLPSNVDSPPICYLQLEGGGRTDVTSICGKNANSSTAATPSITPSAPLTISPAALPPPNFNPAATAGKCNFLDANGKPCPKTDAANPNPTKTDPISF